MKLKQTPDDFEVEEISTLPLDERGHFAFYRLEKRGWTTPDALAAVRRRWRIDARRLSYGGLKDRHAHTIQFFTIFHGPKRGLKHHHVTVSYLGQAGEEYRSQHIAVNRFRIVMRDLEPPHPQPLSSEAGERGARALPLLRGERVGADGVQAALEEVRNVGLPNYFDDQRFGSVGAEGEFIARLLVLGRFEDALRLALTAPYDFDSGEQKREKVLLREHWGDWATCQTRLPRSHARSLVSYLVHHPADFRGAAARLRPDLRTLYLSAYQSHLWNRMLAMWIRRTCPAEQLMEVELQLGKAPMPRTLEPGALDQLRTLRLPLPSARLKLSDADPRLPIVLEVLREEGLELKQMQIKGLRELFFSKGERDAWLQPHELRWEPAADELHLGRWKCTLWFDLPRGCYATMLVKRITA